MWGSEFRGQGSGLRSWVQRVEIGVKKTGRRCMSEVWKLQMDEQGWGRRYRVLS